MTSFISNSLNKRVGEGHSLSHHFCQNLFNRVLSTTLEKAMAPHSSTLAWKILWTVEPGRLQSMGSLRVGHDWVTSLSLFPFIHWRRKWQPTPVFLPGESQGRRAWWAAIYGVAQSRTRLKWLSSSSKLHYTQTLDDHIEPNSVEVGRCMAGKKGSELWGF